MGIAKRLNLVMVSAFALLLGCLMFTSLDTAWGLTYQEGDVWIGTDGEQMTPEEAGQWEYDNDNTNNGIWLKEYTGEYVEGKIVGCVPATINSKPVTSMKETFNWCQYLELAPEIPNSVIDLTGAFANCDALTIAPQIHDSVTNMSHTFEYCWRLTTAPQIPSSVEDLSYAFKSSGIIAAPQIPSSVTNMTQTFSDCSNLTEPSTIPASVTSISSAYSNTAITKSPQILSTNLRYASNAFSGCLNLKEITNIPLAEDISRMFSGCEQLKVVPNIPEGITALEYVFYGCKELEEIPEIPDSAYKLDGLFIGCSKLTGTIYLSNNVTIVNDMFYNTVEPIIVQYRNNTTVENTIFPSNVIKQKLTDEITDPNPGEDKEQDPTTPSNPGETSGNMSIYGTVQPITLIDVTVPLTIQFTIESDRTFTGPDSIEIKSNCPSPLDVNLYGVNKDGSAPSLVAPDTHSDNEWNNLSRSETLASIALMLDNTSLSSTGSTLGRIDSAFQSEKALDLDLSAKYGKAWDNSEDLVFTYNVVFEFAMP